MMLLLHWTMLQVGGGSKRHLETAWERWPGWGEGACWRCLWAA